MEKQTWWDALPKSVEIGCKELSEVLGDNAFWRSQDGWLWNDMLPSPTSMTIFGTVAAALASGGSATGRKTYYAIVPQNHVDRRNATLV
jgi:hypothetical protein